MCKCFIQSIQELSILVLRLNKDNYVIIMLFHFNRSLGKQISGGTVCSNKCLSNYKYSLIIPFLLCSRRNHDQAGLIISLLYKTTLKSMANKQVNNTVSSLGNCFIQSIQEFFAHMLNSYTINPSTHQLVE